MWKQYALCLACAVLGFPAPVRAQSDEYQRLAAEWSELYQRYADGGSTFNQRDYDERQKLWPRMQELRRRMDALNGQRASDANDAVGQLDQQRENLAARTDFFNNVTGLRTRDALDQWVADRRREWGAQNGPRIGIINPYTGAEYYRYYDETSKTLVVSKVRGDYQLLERQRADWEQSYKRAKWLLDSVQGDYDLLQRQFGQAMALKAKYAEAMLPARPTAPPAGQPQPQPQPRDNAYYAIWYDDFKVYGGKSREEAIRSAHDAKRANPNTHIRVTGPEYEQIVGQKSSNGPVILDLP
jgi:hypothetical protein